jgi:malonyl CoA-acyl carrier protein transacylase
MAAIAATEDVVAKYIAEMGLQHQLSIAVYNAADNNVVSGDLKAIEKLMAAVKRDGMRATKLAVAQGKHLIFKSGKLLTLLRFPQSFYCPRSSGS